MVLAGDGQNVGVLQMPWQAGFDVSLGRSIWLGGGGVILGCLGG